MHNIISKAALHYRSELWIFYRQGQKPLGAAQLRLLRVLQGLTVRDKQRNIEIGNRLNQENIVDEIYQQNWLVHVNGMGEKPLIKTSTAVNPMEKRD